MGIARQTDPPLLVLVLDDGDGHDPAVGAMATTLRQAVPGIRLVVTTRDHLRAALPDRAGTDRGATRLAPAPTESPPASPPLHAALSPREREVLGWLAAGLTNREIGAELYLSADAIKKHVSAILRKLGARNRTEAAQLASAILTPPSASPPPSPRAAA